MMRYLRYVWVIRVLVTVSSFSPRSTRKYAGSVAHYVFDKRIATTATSSTASSASSTATDADGTNEERSAFVILARHGDRWDYFQQQQRFQQENDIHNDDEIGLDHWMTTTNRPWDSPLSPLGFLQAAKLGEHLSNEISAQKIPPVTQIYSSPLLRCRQTACAVAAVIHEQRASNNDKPSPLLNVRIEFGLAESLNENWYRSWALPGSDGTWGYIPAEDLATEASGLGTRRALADFRPEELHPASQRAAYELLYDWKQVFGDEDHGDEQLSSQHLLHTLQDFDYASITHIMEEEDVPYSLRPPICLETRQHQQDRMQRVMDMTARPGETILLVSHGGPVSHAHDQIVTAAAERLNAQGSTTTTKNQKGAAATTFCGYSVYKCPIHTSPSLDKTPSQPRCWAPVVVNQSEYLKDLWSDGTPNV